LRAHFELHGAEVAERRVAALGIVEALDVIEHVSFGFVTRVIGFALARSIFSEEKKLSIAALSQTLPDRLMLQMTP
jgi:hypothetical protein